MARFRVREGRVLARHGEVLSAGTVLEIEPDVAADPAVANAIEPWPLPPVAKKAVAASASPQTKDRE